MIINFIPTGDRRYASSRIRAYWVAEEMGGAHVTPPTWVDNETARCDAVDADVYVWQKFADFNFMKERRGAKHYWDLCDPLWWFSPEHSRMFLEFCDDFICCTEALADDFYKWSGVKAHVVPDRMRMAHFTHRRVHQEAEVVKLVWFGIGVNRITLASAWANMARMAANGHKISLTIMDEIPGTKIGFGDEFPIHYSPWALNWEVGVIAQHDIAILPTYPGPWGKLKSNNKNLLAAGCGLPSTTGLDYEELLLLVKSKEKREEEALKALDELERHYDVKASARQLEGIFNEQS